MRFRRPADAAPAAPAALRGAGRDRRAPAPGPPADAGRGTGVGAVRGHRRHCYTFTKDNAQFFVLDSNYLAPEPLAWLEQGLQDSKADWKICFFHHPLYSSGTFHGSSLELREVLEPLFVKYGVQVVFAGHEHVYERVKPQHGVTYFIEGASGRLRRGNLRKPSPLMAAGYDQDRSFMLVAITGDSLTYQAVSRTDQTVDSGTIRRAAKVE